MALVNITKETFKGEVLQSEVPVLVEFWAAWCGPCKTVGPILDEIAIEHSDVKIAKVNIDEQMELAGQFGIMSIPTLIVFKDGKAVKKEVGAKTKEGILAMLK